MNGFQQLSALMHAKPAPRSMKMFHVNQGEQNAE
jgi:hypothetical protein